MNPNTLFLIEDLLAPHPRVFDFIADQEYLRILPFKELDQDFYRTLSSGEQVLARFCCEIVFWDGTFQIRDLLALDELSRAKVLNVLSKVTT